MISDKSLYMCLGKDIVNDKPKFCDEELGASKLETVSLKETDHSLHFKDHREG